MMPILTQKLGRGESFLLAVAPPHVPCDPLGKQTLLVRACFVYVAHAALDLDPQTRSDLQFRAVLTQTGQHCWVKTLLFISCSFKNKFINFVFYFFIVHILQSKPLFIFCVYFTWLMHRNLFFYYLFYPAIEKTSNLASDELLKSI